MMVSFERAASRHPPRTCKQPATVANDQLPMPFPTTTSFNSCSLHVDGAVLLTEVSPGFKASLDDLRATVAGHLSTPHTFGGEEITGGERLQDIMGGLCTAVNSTEDICPPRSVEIAQ